MGVSMESINQGVLDVGKILSSGMQGWNAIMGNKTAATPPLAAATPAVTQGSQTTSQVKTAPALSGTVLVIGAVILAALLLRGR
jgi:hypothetical protein